MVVGGRQHVRTNVTELVMELTNKPRQLKVLMPSLLQRLAAAPAGLYMALMESPLLSTIRLTVIYICASFLAVRVTDPFARWLLISVSFSDFLIASLQEIVLVLMLAEDSKSTFARNLAAFQVAIYALHGSIYLLGCWNLISVPSEQLLYGLADVFAKFLHSIVLGASRKYTQSMNQILLINGAVNAVADVQRLIEDANVPIFSVDQNLTVNAWNRKITELTGRQPNDTRGKSLDMLAANDSTWNSSAQNMILDALSGVGATDPRQICFQMEDGQKRQSSDVIVSFSATPLQDARGEIVGAVCIGQDVTEITKQRKEAQVVAASLSRLIEEAAVPMFEVNLEMRLVGWNAWLVKMMGMSKAVALGTHLQELLSDSCAEEVQKILKNVAGGLANGSERFEVTFQGVNLVLLMNAVPRKDATNTAVSVVCVGQDMTRSKDVDEWKSSMMAVVSHELKSPLHGIIGLSQSLLESASNNAANNDVPSNAATRKALTMVNNSAKKLLDIVTSIMDTSLLLNRKSQVLANTAPDPVSLVNIMEDVIMLNRQAVDKRGVPLLRPGVTLVNRVKGPVPVIEGDAFRITQLFYNLVSNALKFTQQGSVIVSCDADDIEEVLIVYIKDTGVGIAPENLEAIFQPFDQEDHSEKRSYEGLGLGLSICREVVRRHGGSLTVRSKKGEGSTFRVQLPYSMKSKEESSKREPQEMPKQPSTQSFSDYGIGSGELRTKRADQTAFQGVTAQSMLFQAKIPEDSSRTVILSVDDDLVSQQVIKSLVASTFDFKSAVGGSEALNFMRVNELPALVLLEVMMPGMSGMSVLQSLRSSYSPEILPIIMVSARSDKETIISYLKAGANDFVGKPFEQAELLCRINLQLKMSHAARYSVPEHRQEHVWRLFDGMLPQDVISSLRAASSRRTPEATKQAVRIKLERFFKESTMQSPYVDTESQITSLKEELLEAKKQIDKLSAKVSVNETTASSDRKKHTLSMQGIRQRMQMLENQVKEREENLNRLKRWQVSREQGAGPDHLDLCQMVNNFEESIIMKELRINRLTEDMHFAGAEVRRLTQELKEQVLMLFRESRQKDQLLGDANFKLHMLSMTLTQKELQLGQNLHLE